jgi:hypothetical protein
MKEIGVSIVESNTLYIERNYRRFALDRIQGDLHQHSSKISHGTYDTVSIKEKFGDKNIKY